MELRQVIFIFATTLQLFNMKLNQLLLLFLTLIVVKGEAQVSKKNERRKESDFSVIDFYGHIKDGETGEPLGGATIYIPELKVGKIADANGYFSFSNLPKTKLLFEISYQGYGTISDILNKDSLSGTFYLNPIIVEQQEVTVTGVSFATRRRQNPQAVVVVNKADLFSTPSTNLMEALSKNVPGLSVLSTGPAIAKPFIRGLGYNRVITVQDGIKLEGQQWGDEHGIEIDDKNIQKIEVLKGPASLIYGSDAIAGVINIQSQVPAHEGTIKANIISEYQTNSNLIGTYGQIGGTQNGFSWNVYGNYKAAKDYSNKYDGKVFNSRFINKDFGAMAGYRGSWGFSRLYFSQYNLVPGIVEGERDSATGKFVRDFSDGSSGIVKEMDYKSYQPQVPYQKIKHLKFSMDNVFNIGFNRLGVIAAYQNNSRKELGDAEAPDIAETAMQLQTLNYGVKWQFPSHGNWNTAIGINGMYQKNKNLVEERVIPDYNLLDAGIYVFSQYIKNKISLSGGLRYDTRHLNAGEMENEIIKSNAFERHFSNISGSIGMTYRLIDQIYLKANIARGFRAPNLAELGSNGVHEGTFRYEIGNKDLKNEVSLQADLGIEVNTSHFAFSASLFYNSIDHFIYASKISNSNGSDSIIIDPESGSETVVYKYNSGNAFLYGGEFYFDLHPHPLDWLHFENTFSYTIGQFRNEIDGSKNLPLIPPAKWVSELKAKFYPKGKTIRNLFLSFSGEYNFKQNRPFTAFGTETETNAYLLLNSAVGMEVIGKNKTLFSFSLSANNLTNTAYQSHLSRLKYSDINYVTGRRGVFQQGRSFSIKVNIPILIKE